ncbi:MAG: peptide chain release factor N(5)-glutamine methyltransferase [Neomegalonema sp.]|nr:peptide chain release factor N(5)-glutamine methyltransferase [Neomegalonema sp.]
MIGSAPENRKAAPSRDALMRDAVAQLKTAEVPNPGREARLLMRFACDLDAAGLSARAGQQATPQEVQRFEKALARRLRREPLSHITGERAFLDHVFEVTPDVLDPRADSEVLVLRAIACAKGRSDGARGDGEGIRVLDLGVGSGCLLLSVLAACPQATGLGVDASPAALDVAQRNASRLGVADRVSLERGDWLRGIESHFDVILCNPPYIDLEELAELEPEVRLHEPLMALSPGLDGLIVYLHLAPLLRSVMRPQAVALFEVGHRQGEAVAQIFGAVDFMVVTHRDLSGVIRVVEVT